MKTYVIMRQTFCVKISELRVDMMDNVYAVRLYFILLNIFGY